MLRRMKSPWIALAVLLGCGDSPAATPLVIDAVVHGDTVMVYAREVERACRCATGELPVPGECVRLLDVAGCTCSPPPPASCLESVRIEAGGAVVAEVTWSDELAEQGVVELEAELGALTDPELVVVGCGSVHRAPLATGDAPSVTLEELTYDQATLGIVGTVPAGVTTVLGSFDYLVGSTNCRALAGPRVDIPAPYSFEYGQSRVLLWAYATAEHGAVRVHAAGNASVDEVFLPNQLDDGRWILPPFIATAPIVTLAVDGAAPIVERIAPSFAAADVAVAEPLLELMGSGETAIGSFRYLGGETDDTLSIEIGGVVYSGAFPHAPPTDGLDVGVPEPDHVAWALGPATLERDGVPAETITVNGFVAWDLGVVARPIE